MIKIVNVDFTSVSHKTLETLHI